MKLLLINFQSYLLRTPGVTPQCVIPPPQYTPQMAQEFRAKQR